MIALWLMPAKLLRPCPLVVHDKLRLSKSWAAVEGRLVLDEPTDLPRGSDVSLGLAEELVRMPEQRFTAAIVERALLAAGNQEL